MKIHLTVAITYALIAAVVWQVIGGNLAASTTMGLLCLAIYATSWYINERVDQ